MVGTIAATNASLQQSEGATAGMTLLSAGLDAPLETNPEVKHCLESNVRLRDSVLWKLQQGYVEALSAQGWPDEVPLFASSNAKLAQDYARLIFNYLRDVYTSSQLAGRGAESAVPESADGPCLLVEIGAGHGRFTYMLLSSLLEFQPYFEPLGMPARPFILVLTDAIHTCVDCLRDHPDLQPFVDGGWLDFGIFDVSEPLVLEELLVLARRHGCRGIPVDGSSGNPTIDEVPVVAICNYALDSMVQEALQFSGTPRLVREGLLSVYSTQEEPTFRDPGLTERLSFAWSWQESQLLAQAAMALDASDLDLPGEYDEGYLAVVREYLGTGETMTALLPLAGFRIATTLRSLAGQQFLMLIGDKGYQDASEFVGWQTPHIAVHGSFSMMVNFDALRIYFESFGGWAEHTPYQDVFQVWVYASGARNQFPSLLSSLVDCRNDLGPGSMMFWSKGITQHWDESLTGKETITHDMVSTVMALLRYGRHDPDLFWQFQPLIHAQCNEQHFLDSRGIQDLSTDLMLVYRKQFRVHGCDHRDLAAAIGDCLMRMGRIEQAVSLFRKSLEDCGPKSEVLLKLSACLEAAGRRSEAVEATEAALRLDPSYVSEQSRRQNSELDAEILGTALIGGSFTMFEQVLPSLAKDMRFQLKAVHAFAEEEARLMAAALENWQLDFQSFRPPPGLSLNGTAVGLTLQNQTKVLWGADGLKEIMQRSDITVCIADVHHKMLPGMLQKLWAAGKHVLSPSPLAYSLEAARALISTYQTPQPGILVRPAWHALESARYEDALNVASQSLEKVGRPLCISLAIRSSKTPATRKARAPVEEKLALELVHSLLVVQRVSNEKLASIVVQVATPGTQEGKSEAALTGHFSLHPSAATISSGAAAAPSIGTFIVCHAGGTASEPGLEACFHCAQGALVLRQEKATWQITVTDDCSGAHGQKSIERLAPAMGHNLSRKAFLQQIQRSGAVGTLPDNAPVDMSVQHALADTAILESVLKSMRTNGANMGFKYNS